RRFDRHGSIHAVILTAEVRMKDALASHFLAEPASRAGQPSCHQGTFELWCAGSDVDRER
ncbi:MAG: hypothetical protein WBQ39_12495, partial [Terriglobales bacterium]